MKEHLKLPNHVDRQRSGASGYLYALEFADGSIKIGRSAHPRNRAAGLAREYRQRIVRGHAAPINGRRGHVQAERFALAVVRRIAVQDHLRTEVFHGLKFGEAVNAVKQMARRADDSTRQAA